MAEGKNPGKPATPPNPRNPNNQGEGDRESARRFNQDQQEFVKSGRVDEAARQAKEDPEAERKARARAKEFDPEENRDYSKPEKPEKSK